MDESQTIKTISRLMPIIEHQNKAVEMLRGDWSDDTMSTVLRCASNYAATSDVVASPDELRRNAANAVGIAVGAICLLLARGERVV